MPATDAPQGLKDYLSVLRRRKLAVWLTCLLVTGSALAFSFSQTKIYEARTRLLLSSSQSTVGEVGIGQYIDPNRIQTEIQVLQGKPVQDLVRETIGRAPVISARSPTCRSGSTS